jgi:hypothetical protein
MGPVKTSHAAGQPLPRAGWSVACADREEPGAGDLANNAIDGNPDTKWHTQWIGSNRQPVG